MVATDEKGALCVKWGREEKTRHALVAAAPVRLAAAKLISLTVTVAVAHLALSARPVRKVRKGLPARKALSARRDPLAHRALSVRWAQPVQQERQVPEVPKGLKVK